MNLRTKSAALVAALALSMTFTGGIASAQSTTAVLQDTAPRACTLTVDSGTNVGFGTFSWNGSVYTGTASTGTINAVLSHNGTKNNRHCNQIQATGTNLTQGPDIAFNASSVNVGSSTSGIASTVPVASGQDIPVGQTATVPLTVKVSGVPLPSAPTGTYTGTITLSLSTAL